MPFPQNLRKSKEELILCGKWRVVERDWLPVSQVTTLVRTRFTCFICALCSVGTEPGPQVPELCSQGPSLLRAVRATTAPLQDREEGVSPEPTSLHKSQVLTHLEYSHWRHQTTKRKHHSKADEGPPC